MTILAVLQTGCACTHMVNRLGETRINLSQPRCVHLMSDGSMVAESTLRHERAKDQALVREDPRYFVISASCLSNELGRANSRGEISVALTRNNTTMYPDTLEACSPQLITFPVDGPIEGSYTNEHGPTSNFGDYVPYNISNRVYRVEVRRSYSYGPTYKPFGYKWLSFLLYGPAFVIDTITFPIQAATWHYGPGP